MMQLEMAEQFKRVELSTITLNEGMGPWEMPFDVSTIYDSSKKRYETVVFGPQGSIAEAKAETLDDALDNHNEVEALIWSRKLDFYDYTVL
jgi:hypothetical protein